MTTNLVDLKKLTTQQLLGQIEILAKRQDVPLSTLLDTCGYALGREMNQSERLLDTVEAIIIGLNTEGVVTLLSRRACELLGYEKRELLGKSWFLTCLPQPEGMEVVYLAFQQLMAGEREGVEYYENDIVTRSGERRRIAWRNRYLRDAEGKVIGSLSAGEDITERKQAEEQSAKLLEENRRLMQKLFRLQETERKHLARELHDELGQWLAAVQAHAQAMLGYDQPSPPDVQTSAKVIIDCISEVQQGVHRMIKQLRPAVLDELGLEDSLRELVSQWSVRHPDITCKLAVAGSLDDVDDTLVITIYRLIQEALTNVARHASARHVEIALDRARNQATGTDTLRLVIGDDGKGMPAESGGGLGLLSMRERVLVAGGTYDLSSCPGRGVRIEAKLPLVPPQDQEQASDQPGNNYGTSD